MLDRLERTGRARTHVVRSEALGCDLVPAAADALVALRDAARADGIDPTPVSAFRDFERQRRIWNAKLRGERPLLDRLGRPVDPDGLSVDQRVDAALVWSMLPGASRHHWGTEVDLVDRTAPSPDDPLVPAAYAPGGPFERLAGWLDRHAGAFGFYRPYDVDRGGVQPEPWHLSYAPIAGPTLETLTVEVLAEALADAAVEGREAILARLPELHERYVLRVARR